MSFLIRSSDKCETPKAGPAVNRRPRPSGRNNAGQPRMDTDRHRWGRVRSAVFQSGTRLPDSGPTQLEPIPRFVPQNLCPSVFICGFLLHGYGSAMVGLASYAKRLPAFPVAVAKVDLFGQVSPGETCLPILGNESSRPRSMSERGRLGRSNKRSLKGQEESRPGRPIGSCSARGRAHSGRELGRPGPGCVRIGPN